MDTATEGAVMVILITPTWRVNIFSAVRNIFN
jgi:hypothetical protein